MRELTKQLNDRPPFGDAVWAVLAIEDKALRRDAQRMWYIVAIKSSGITGFVLGYAACWSLEPNTCPPRTPPPASTTDWQGPNDRGRRPC